MIYICENRIIRKTKKDEENRRRSLCRVAPSTAAAAETEAAAEDAEAEDSSLDAVEAAEEAVSEVDSETVELPPPELQEARALTARAAARIEVRVLFSMGLSFLSVVRCRGYSANFSSNISIRLLMLSMMWMPLDVTYSLER